MEDRRIRYRLGTLVCAMLVGIVLPSVQPQALAQGSEAPLTDVDRSRLREIAIDELVLLAASEDPQVRANAIEGLIPAPARLEVVLPAALADPNEGVRTVAAIAVGEAEFEDLADVVRPLLREESDFVRAAAIYALRINGATDVNPTPLGSMVTKSDSPGVRAHAAYLLGKLGDRGTIRLLREAASLNVPRASAAENKVLGVQIAEALVRLDDEEQVQTIRAALYPATPAELDATVLAAQVLGQLDDRASEGQLRSLLGMRDPFGAPMPVEVRLAAAGALGRMGQPVPVGEVVQVLTTGTEPQQIQAASALGEIAGSAAIGHLEARLGEGTERVRVAIAAGLLRAVRR